VAAGFIPPAVAFLALLLLLAPTASAQPTVTVEVAPGEHTVGDRIAVVVVVTTAAGSPAPRFPDWDEDWGTAEIVEIGEVETAEAPGGGVAYRQRLTLAAFETGRVPLPPQTVVLPIEGLAGQRLETPPAVLDVASVLPLAADGEARPAPKPARPPRVPPIGAPFWWTFALLASAVAALLALLLWRFRRRAESRGAMAALPPIGELDAGLAAARQASDPAEGLRRVSWSLRRYLGRRLGFNAVESTSSEIRRRLSHRRLPDGVARTSLDLLFACDLVKFAGRPAARGDVERWAASARELAGKIEQHLTPVALPPAAAARREAA
jgi:hypothetical protein